MYQVQRKRSFAAAGDETHVTPSVFPAPYENPEILWRLKKVSQKLYQVNY